MEAEKIIGKINGVEISKGESKEGKPWTRGKINLDLPNGKTISVSTFNEQDIDKANRLNGKDVEVKFTSTESNYNGKPITYRNLIPNGIMKVEKDPYSDDNSEPVFKKASDTENGFKEDLKQSLEDVMSVLSNTDIEWKTEDIRSMAISLFIQRRRENGSR